jgi:predicted ATPase with chaperone activity
MPSAPQTLEQTGVGMDIVLELVAKTLYMVGELTGNELAARLGVHYTVIEPGLDLLRRDRQCEIVTGSVLGGPSYRYRLTDAGRVRAATFWSQNQYIGQIPVPLAQYVAYMRSVAQDRSLVVSRSTVRQAFAHLVLSDRVLDELGPAIAARHSLFIYGPPGNGKTVIAQAIRNVLVGDIAIPYAVTVDGHIIRLFDPVNHEPVQAPGEPDQLTRISDSDGRWVRCRRPLVTVGGEMTLDAVDLWYSSASGLYRAPIQALANGGVLVIDDFGRQHASPRDLLNRWVVPLETRVDHLTLQTGQKFEMPFETLIVFATNLKPADLVDEAFLRRIQYKVYAESPTLEEFVQIFANYCRDHQLDFDPGLLERFIAAELTPRNVQLRGCQPRDLIEHALAQATYLDRPRALTGELLAAAASTYFIHDSETAAA